jgi:hypothetical protein
MFSGAWKDAGMGFGRMVVSLKESPHRHHVVVQGLSAATDFASARRARLGLMPAASTSSRLAEIGQPIASSAAIPRTYPREENAGARVRRGIPSRPQRAQRSIPTDVGQLERARRGI